jgi:endonuclease-3
MKDTVRNVAQVVRLLEQSFGEKEAVVWHENPFRVLVSTVLSQRTRDENTEIASRRLFKVYKTPKELAHAPVKKIEALVKSSGFYRAKSRNIKELSRIILRDFDGRTPDNIEDLITLPGVGRKTANCVLVYGFNKPAIPVDTHVHRISNRLGWVKTKNPEETEARLTESIPKKYWIRINNLMVKFGQEICKPIKPYCNKCPITEYCAYYKNNF